MQKLYKGDCLEIMSKLPEKSVDLILCDLPYGVTECKWDSVIPFESLWNFPRTCGGDPMLGEDE